MSELPIGFRFGSSACGIKSDGKLDLAVIYSEPSAVMAGVYTMNAVRATSIDWNRAITPSASFKGVLINSGNANACTGEQGKRDNQAMALATAKCLEVESNQIGVLSTGIIGVHLPIEQIQSAIAPMIENSGSDVQDFESAASAIMTSDKFPKHLRKVVAIGETPVAIAAMAKGAGMIGPNMATMLAMVCCDAKVEQTRAQEMIKRVANRSFNKISVEGHTSTNDAMMVMFSQQVALSDSELDALEAELTEVCIQLAKMIPTDGEGASHLIEIQVAGAANDSDADRIARTIASSNLVKTAVTGADPNWGRIVSAAGYCGCEIDMPTTSLMINGHVVFDQGEPSRFDNEEVSKSMRDQFETKLELVVGKGEGRATHWTSDLTVDYVRFNSEYTT